MDTDIHFNIILSSTVGCSKRNVPFRFCTQFSIRFTRSVVVTRLLASLCGAEKIKQSRSTWHAPPVSTTDTESMNLSEQCTCFPRGIQLTDSSQVKSRTATTLCRLQLCQVMSFLKYMPVGYENVPYTFFSIYSPVIFLPLGREDNIPPDTLSHKIRFSTTYSIFDILVHVRVT